MSEYSVEVENLVTHYGSRKILDGVNMQVEEGEIRVIMGGSGSGKSTMLKLLTRLFGGFLKGFLFFFDG